MRIPLSAAGLCLHLGLLPLLAPASSIAILERATIFTHTGTDPRDPANATGFNHAPSVAVLPDSRIQVAWFTGPFEGSSRQKVLGATSSDQGRTWSAPTTLQDFQGRADFDPAFIVSERQTLLFFSAGLRRVSPFETGQQGPVGDDHHRIYLRTSQDSGRTWSPSREIGNQPAHTTRTNGIRLSTGELLVPIHRLGTKAGGVLRSTDGGKTWTRCGFVATPAGEGGEPAVAELGSGRVMMLLRTRDGELWRAFSSDKGETWGAPEKTGMPAGATSHSLIRTRAGKLVLTYNPSKPPVRNPLTMRVSADEGETWGEPVVLAELGFPVTDATWQVCYPSVAELPDGTLIAVWARLRGAADEKYGDIHAARVRID